jgi:UDP-glucose 4-epimerase
MDTSYRGQKVLVTGASGFVGRHLVRALLGAGAEVGAMARRHVETATQSFAGDLRDAGFVGDTIGSWQPKVIFHLAATRLRSLDPANMRDAIDANVGGILNVLSASVDLPDLPSVVALGSGEEYGSAPTPYEESLRELPISAYSVSKLSATHLCQMLAHTRGLPVCILRPSVVYGPEQPTDMFVPALVRALLRRERFPMTAGAQTRDFVFVGDLVEAILLAGSAPALGGEVINIGSGRAISIAALADRLETMTGYKGHTDRGAVAYREVELMTYAMNITKAERLLGWRPATTLDDGLAQTIAWYRDN